MMVRHAPSRSNSEPRFEPNSGAVHLAPERIPAQLRKLKSWVGWRYEPRPGRPKPAKVPVNPRDGSNASVSRPGTWGSFPAAVRSVDRFDLDGVGVVLTARAELVGVDLDDCLDTNTGGLDAWAGEILDRLAGTYAEYSPSGCGVRLFVEGRLPSGACRRCGDIEVYDSGRYLTATGNPLPGRPSAIARDPVGLEWLISKYLTPPTANTAIRPAVEPVTQSDAELITRASAARNSPKFRRLWSGDTAGYFSASEADLALVALLAFWAGGDRERIDALFRQSGLYRPKWDARRGTSTYGARTIATALSNCREFYGGGSGPPTFPSRARSQERTTTLCFKSDSRRGAGRDSTDDRLYDLVAELRARHGRPVGMSNRVAAPILGVSQPTVSRAFGRLLETGRLVLTEPGTYRGLRAAVYELGHLAKS